MRRVVLLVLLMIGFTTNVQAANYELMELIPVNKETTIVTKNFSYQNFYYNDNQLEAEALKNNFIIFEKIKNISEEERPVSISIGLFDKDKLNIGIVNYCSTNDKYSAVAGTRLKPDEEMSYVIEVNERDLANDKSMNDIEYIAILSDNENCRIGGSKDFIGSKIEDIGLDKNTIIDDNTKLLIKILILIGGVGLVIFLYQFVFSSRFRNFNGSDVRQEYAYINKKLKKEREELSKNTPPPVEKPKEKRKEVLEQEAREALKENKEESDLHNFYK